MDSEAKDNSDAREVEPPSPIVKALELHLDALCGQPFEALSLLPESQLELIPAPGGPLKALLWRDRVSEGQLRLVLQSCELGFCCGGELSAVGRTVADDGRVEPVQDAALEEFRLV